MGKIQPLIVRSKAGIKRDGTQFDGDYYIDGQWMRFQRGLPRKILGYLQLSAQLGGICRGIRTYTQSNLTFCHLGYSNRLEQFYLDSEGNSSAIVNRTPVGLVANPENAWQFDVIVDATTLDNPVNQIIAQVAPNLNCVCNTAQGAVYIGNLTASTPLTPVTIPTGISVTGGVVALHPYAVYFGNDGSIAWSAPGRPTVLYEFQEQNTGLTVLASTINTSVFTYTQRSGVTDLVVSDTLAFVSAANNVTYTVTNVVLPTAPATTVTVTVDVSFGQNPPPVGAAIFRFTTTATGAGNARVASQKIVKGYPLRGGAGNSPSGIFWSADAVLRMTFVGGDLVFQFDTISSQSSILSPNSVIEYDGVYYWVGTDRFLVFNGVVRDLPNDLNINWFFDNLNRNETQKVFAFKVPRYGEIWWCFPFGTATECTHAVIFNLKENTWYDTILPNSGRSAGEFSPVYAYPLLTGVNVTDPSAQSPQYKLWQHETNYDEIDGSRINPILSYFETADYSLIAQPQGVSKWMKVHVVEPDFVQVGTMQLVISGRTNSRSRLIVGAPRDFVAKPTKPEEQVLFFKEQYRELRFKFISNAIGGNYLMGQVIAHVEETDGTYLGGLDA